MSDPSDRDLDTIQPSADPAVSDGVKEPPRTFFSTLRHLGPGLIIAASIVGSGELIATTKTGAQAGISLLWLIIIGCLIKVFVQVELGRFTITHGETTLAALNSVPGPFALLGIKTNVPIPNWIVLFWWAMMITGMAQLGGIVGGVGQAMAMATPITGDYREAVLTPSTKELQWYLEWQEKIETNHPEFQALSDYEQARRRRGLDRIEQDLNVIAPHGDEVLDTIRSGGTPAEVTTYDDRYWASALTIVTCLLLVSGRYGIIQTVSTVFVVAFTFITIGNVIQLQRTPQWHISTEQFLRGLSFSLPEGSGLKTALATFGIIGVGASELVSYPYWCIEKGYAKFAGKRTQDDSWAKRARGWMRVMLCDAFMSMVIYTIATLAFFLMGVSVLHNEGRDPDGMRMVSTLATAYVPVFGEHAKWLFLIGAFAVLYSTFLVASAGHARTYTDAFKLLNLIPRNSERAHRRSVSTVGVALPLISLATYWSGINPVKAVLIAGLMQAILLPMLGFAALYFRWTATDPRLKPRPAWDLFLVLSCVGLLITGLWGAVKALEDLWASVSAM